MSLQYDGPGTIPAETVRVARAAFPQGAVAMGMRDLLGGFVRDHDLDRVYLLRGRPVEAPWRMALVTVLQFMAAHTQSAGVGRGDPARGAQQSGSGGPRLGARPRAGGLARSV